MVESGVIIPSTKLTDDLVATIEQMTDNNASRDQLDDK